jgi:hypothetical protein
MDNMQKREAEDTLARLIAEARTLSWGFAGELGASLRATPEYVVFDCQLDSVNVRYYTPAGNNRVYKSGEGSERVVALTNEIRSAMLRVAALS